MTRRLRRTVLVLQMDDHRRRQRKKGAGTCDLFDLRTSRGGGGRFPQRDDALWDSYLLFDRDAVWNSAPTGLLSWGFTVLRTRQKLAADLQYARRCRESLHSMTRARLVSQPGARRRTGEFFSAVRR